MTHTISNKHLTIERVNEIISKGLKLQLSKESEEAIIKCRRFLDSKMSDIGRPVYGVTTGFGSLCNITIPEKELSQLQHNLVMSHACGTGDTVRPEIVKLMLLLKIQSLSYGFSGVQLVTVQRLIDMFNNDILPVVYQQGSLGASGDLAPLAHLCLPLIGMGEVVYKGKVRSAADHRLLTQGSLQGLRCLCLWSRKHSACCTAVLPAGLRSRVDRELPEDNEGLVLLCPTPHPG